MTAKPAPASPARAPSTATLSARRLVWNAIASIDFPIFAILPPAVVYGENVAHAVAVRKLLEA